MYIPNRYHPALWGAFAALVLLSTHTTLSVLSPAEYTVHNGKIEWSRPLMLASTLTNILLCAASVWISSIMMLIVSSVEGLPRKGLWTLYSLFIFMSGVVAASRCLMIWEPWLEVTWAGMTAISAVCTVFVLMRKRHVFGEEVRLVSQLAISQEVMRRVFDNLPIPVTVLDRGLRYIAVSRVWEETFGHSQAAVMGRSLLEIVPHVHEKWLEDYRRCLRGAVPKLEIDDVVKHPDGKVETLHRKVVPLKNSSGEVEALIMFTERLSYV